ncbi:MAG: hypothetical protein DRQ88_08090 [Epsilonproteobacteria bacterium]|nr:MAG: hypothetical protein DRQ89_09110 [Campylobacterota bacterium]RLA66012.1 MAG: hypothetical protein DRQ88_08090 [Campylobacterota bacterium]
MTKFYLIFLLGIGFFTQQVWGQGSPRGVSGFDVSQCSVNTRQQTKVSRKNPDGTTSWVCTGQAVCGGKTVPVSCKIASQKTPCPTTKLCFPIDDEYTQNCHRTDGVVKITDCDSSGGYYKVGRVYDFKVIQWKKDRDIFPACGKWFKVEGMTRDDWKRTKPSYTQTSFLSNPVELKFNAPALAGIVRAKVGRTYLQCPPHPVKR